MSVAAPASAMSDQQLSALLEDIEDCLKAQGDLDLERQLRRLEQLLDYVVHDRLTPEQAMHMKAAAMPKLVLMLLKVRTGAAMSSQLNGFFQHTLDVTVRMLRDTNSWEMVESATRILTDGTNHHFYNQALTQTPQSPSCDAESQSSGEASCSEASDDDEQEPAGSVLKPGATRGEASPFYVQNIEHFHAAGGFDVIIERILREPRLTLTAVKIMLRPFVKVKHMLRRSALQGYARRVHRALMEHVSSLTHEQLKPEDRKSMSDVHRQLDIIVHTAKLPDATTSLDLFHLSLALKCLKTPYLEKRLCGLNDVKEMINISLRKQEYLESLERQERGHKTAVALADANELPGDSSWSTPDFLVQWLQQEKVVELIFGESLHDQVVKRCVELLGFLAIRNALDSRLLEVMWRASLDKHESVRQAIYLVLVDLSAHLPLPLLDELYEHIRTVSPADQTSHTLGLLRGFSIAAIASPHNPSNGKRWYGLDDFWMLLQDATPVGSDVRATAAGMLGDLLTWPQCAPQRSVFLQRCVQQLRDGSSVPQSLRLCCKILSSFPCKVRKKVDSISSVLEWLATEHQLLPAFFHDFQRSHYAAKQRAAAAEQSVAHAMREGTSHTISAAEAALSNVRMERMRELQERLDFLSFCTINAPLSLEQQQLDVLWECCVVNPCCPQEEDQVFHWLEQARMNSAHALCEEATTHLFSRASTLPLERLSPTAYSFLEYFFRWINWKDRRFIQQEPHTFTVLALPLFGADTLWQVALRARNEQVGKHVVSLLTQLHHSLSPALTDQHAQQRLHFVNTCMASLGAAATQLRALQQVPRGECVMSEGEWGEQEALSLRIERCLTLLRLFVEEVENKTGSGRRSQRHGTTVRGVPMRVQVTVVGGSNTPKLEVITDSSQTIGSLRNSIWQELAHHGEWQPETPRMLRIITAGKELKDDLTMLSELKLREPYSVHVMRRQHLTPPQAPADVRASGVMITEDTERQGTDGSPAPALEGSTCSGTSDEGSAGSPGLLLSEKGTNFSTLFDLLSLRDERLSNKVWQLLMMLPTNRTMQAELTALAAANRPPIMEDDWAAILHSGPSSFKLLYSLQIVDRLMVSSEVNPPIHGTSHSDGPARGCRKWEDTFVEQGGLRHLLGLLAQGDLLDEQRGSQRKPCLVLLLRILCQFLLEAWAVAEPLPTASLEVAELVLPANPPNPAATYSRRSFSPMRRDTTHRLRDERQTLELGKQLMQLLVQVAEEKAEDTAEQQDDRQVMGQPAVEGSEVALDLQIGREALQLLVGIVQSTPAVLDLLCDENSLPAWLHSMLLRCPNAQLRLEVCAALHTLASDPRACAGSSPALSCAGRRVQGVTIAALLQLMPSAEAHSSRCRQYFELLQALVTRDCTSDTPQQSPLQLCQQIVDLLPAQGERERRDCPEQVDYVLLGNLTLLHSLVHALPELKPSIGSASHGGLISKLFSALFLLPSVGEARLRGVEAPPTCKSPENRAAALQLLAELANGCEDNLTELLELLLRIQLQRSATGPPLTQWHYMPSAQEKARCGYVGLKNLGATCYLNSLMQQLFMIPECRKAILELPIPSPPPATPSATVNGPAAHAALLYQLQLMFGYLQESEKKSYDTRELCATYRGCEGRPINPSIQMDADEFFNVLFYQLETVLKDSPQPRVLQSLFGGYIVNQIVSKEKGKLSERVEPFYTISIEVKSKRSVLEGLAQYVEGEVLDGDNKYKCESGEYVEAVKRTCIHTLPPVLIIHLKRFEFDFDLMKKMKVNDHCEFPSVINMERFTMEYQEKHASDPSADGVDAPGSAADGMVYQLAGVLVHSGTSDSGHYYSFIRERRVNQAGGGRGWLHFNDTLVEPFDERDIPKCCYGGVEPISQVQWDADLSKHVQRTMPRQHSAYMLFYERMPGPKAEPAPSATMSGRDNATPQHTKTDEKTTAAEPSAGGAHVEAGAQPPAGAVECSSVSGTKNKCPDGEEPRGFATLAEGPCAVSVPEVIIRSVWSENMQFLRDRYIFDSLHFALVRHAVAFALSASSSDLAALHSPIRERSSLSMQSECDSRRFRALELGCRFVVETFAHAKDKSLLPDWLALLTSGLTDCLPACRWLLVQADKLGWLRKMLLVCSIAEVRTGFAQLLLHAMRCLREHEICLFAEEPAFVVRKHPEVVAFSSTSSDESDGNGGDMDIDCAQTPERLPASRPMLGPELPPASESRAQRSTSVAESANATSTMPRAASVCTVEALLGLLPDAASHWRHFPQFFFVLLEFANLGSEERAWLLSRRVVSQLIDFYLGDDSPFATSSVDAQHRPKRTRMGDKFALPNLDQMVALISLLARSCARLETPEETPMSLEMPLLHMSAEEHELAIHPTFVSALLKDGLNVGALSSLLQHYCFDSTACSTNVLQVLLHGIDTMDSDALGPYLHVFTVIVQIRDSIQKWRTDVAMDRLMRVIANNMRYKHATVASLRMLTSLHAAPLVRRWMFAEQATWLLDWLLCGPSDLVRQTAEQLCFALITAEVADAPTQPVADEQQDNVPPALVAMQDQLISMLPMATSIAQEMGAPDQNAKGSSFADDQPVPRLAPFFRVCTYCARQGPLPTVSMDELAQTYAVVDGLHWECDENKREILRYWYVAAQFQSRVDGAGALAATNFRRLLDSFISLRPNERSLKYNREVLPMFYGLLQCALHSRTGSSCLQVLQSHRNFEWAIKYLLIESQDYTQLMTTGDHERSLGPILIWLLKQCSMSVPFRHKIITAALSANKLPAHANNIIVLLALYVQTDEDKALACELDVLPQLSTCVESLASLGGLDVRLLDHIDEALRIMARICDWLKGLPLDNERRVRTLAGWDLSSTSTPLLKMLFTLLHSPHSNGIDVSKSRTSERLRASCLEFACQLAALDFYSAQVVLKALLAQHAPAPDIEMADAEGYTGGSEMPQLLSQTLANIPLSQSRQVASAHSAQLLPYYGFASQLLYGSLNGHSHDPSFVSEVPTKLPTKLSSVEISASVTAQALRLAVLLAIETAVLVEAHQKFACLLHQACELPRESMMYKLLISEMASGGVALLNRVLLEEPVVLLDSCARACCKALLRVAPPSVEWIRNTLDQIAQLILQIQSASGSDSQFREAGTSADGRSIQAFRHSVKLLIDTPVPAGMDSSASSGETSASARDLEQYWLARHGHALPLLEEVNTSQNEPTECVTEPS